MIAQANKRNIPVITDPKGHDFSKYQGTTVIKPNLSEAYGAVNSPPHVSLEVVANKILQITGSEMLMITRSEAGLSVFDRLGQRSDFPVHVRQVKDVTGAGDTVLAMLTYAIANRLSYAEAAQLCNMAAGISLEYVGCARITLSDLAYCLLQRDVSNKVFDEEHLYALQEALKQRRFVLLTLLETETFSLSLFRAIKSLTQPKVNLLIYLNDLNPNEGFIEILASLKEVDFILIHPESLKRICETVAPIESYVLEKDGLKKISHFSVLLEA